MLKQRRIAHLELIKLDIEGAEIPVLYNMLENGIFPSQILVEFDELLMLTRHSKEACEACDAALRKNGYACVYWNGGSNFAYARKALLDPAGG